MMNNEEYQVAYLKLLKNIDLNLFRLVYMVDEFFSQEYEMDFIFSEDDHSELPNVD